MPSTTQVFPAQPIPPVQTVRVPTFFLPSRTELGVQLPDIGRRLGRAGQFVGLSLARHRRDFSQTDRLMLELLRPHFAATLERLHELALTRAVLAGAQAGEDRWVVLFTSRAPYRDGEAFRRLGLSKRQAEVLARATEGLSAAEIADRLVLSRRTVEKHFDAAYMRLGARNRSQAISIAIGRLGAG